MNYGELKTELRSLINRRDVTDDLAARFIRLAQERLERWPQVDPMSYAPRPWFTQKKIELSIANGDISSTGKFTLPVDYLELITIYTEDGVLERAAPEQFLRYPATYADTPRLYLQTGRDIELRPLPGTNTPVSVVYHRAEDAFLNNDSRNGWSDYASEAMLYGAAEFAADYYEDERLDRFSARFLGALKDLQDQAITEAMTGPMTIRPSYSLDDEYLN